MSKNRFNGLIQSKNASPMPQSFNKIWIHAVWATKERASLIHSSVKQKVYQFIRNQLEGNRLSSKDNKWNARSYPLFIFTQSTKIYC